MIVLSAILFSVNQCAVTPKLQENSWMYMPGAAFIKVMMDSPKRNSLNRTKQKRFKGNKNKN